MLGNLFSISYKTSLEQVKNCFSSLKGKNQNLSFSGSSFDSIPPRLIQVKIRIFWGNETKFGLLETNFEHKQIKL